MKAARVSVTKVLTGGWVDDMDDLQVVMMCNGDLDEFIDDAAWTVERIDPEDKPTEKDWDTRITEARARGYFTEGDKDLAFKLPTWDFDLRARFANEVCLDHFDKAEGFLRVIEVGEIERIANVDKSAEGLDIQ